MSDENSTETAPANPSPAEASKPAGGLLGKITAFTNPSGGISSNAGASTGTTANKGGRPRLDGRPPGSNKSPMPPPPIPARLSMEDKANRDIFETTLKELLIIATEDWANERFEALSHVTSKEIAQALADPMRLTDSERKILGPVVIRIYYKYVGDGFKYSDEMLLGVITIKIGIRNISAYKKTMELLKTNVTGTATAERSGLQSPTHINSGNNGGGEKHDRAKAA